MLAPFVGVTFWPVWFYSEKLATLISLQPLVISFALNAVLDAALAAVVLRSKLTTGRLARCSWTRRPLDNTTVRTDSRRVD